MARTKREAKREVLGESHEARAVYLLGTDCETEFLALDGSVANGYICFLVWPLSETALCVLCNCLVAALPGREKAAGRRCWF